MLHLTRGTGIEGRGQRKNHRRQLSFLGRYRSWLLLFFSIFFSFLDPLVFFVFLSCYYICFLSRVLHQNQTTYCYTHIFRYDERVGWSVAICTLLLYKGARVAWYLFYSCVDKFFCPSACFCFRCLVGLGLGCTVDETWPGVGWGVYTVYCYCFWGVVVLESITDLGRLWCCLFSNIG
ncbi:hypothetical protein B0T22DRAFT_462898 [Podospora appendiculata]|uniref:Uncharacterized protein n=1 Tax=Podospora appendiculata TaxID=314037 RepID=A0AAE1CE08_9PEZI|nr:hypothetical protein B0T22DRAFT_462898 [Podospora appendiculata]